MVCSDSRSNWLGQQICKRILFLFLMTMVFLPSCVWGEDFQTTGKHNRQAAEITQSFSQQTSSQESQTITESSAISEIQEVSETSVPETDASTEPSSAPALPDSLYRDPKTFPVPDPNTHYVALTFDDGPHADNTSRLLNALREYKVPACFFLVGDRLQHPGNFAVAQRAHQEGHLLANHSWQHPDLTLLKPAELRREIDGTDDLIRQITGDIAPFIRPPYGSFNQDVQAQMYRPLALWSIDPRDWDAGMSGEAIVESVLQQLEARRPYGRGDIVLLHDIHAKSIDAAISLLQILPQRGYTLVRLDDLLYMAGEQLNPGQAYYALP